MSKEDWERGDAVEFVYVNGIKCLAQCQCRSTWFYASNDNYLCGDCGALYDRQWKLIHEDDGHDNGLEDPC